MSKPGSTFYTDLQNHGDDFVHINRNSDWSVLETNLQHKHQLLKIIDQKYDEVYKENRRLKKEKDEALSRLSQLAGQKLTKGNPTITDLGNPNRPEKIGERWSSLYTDEWTDAYDELGDKKQKHVKNPEKQLLWNTVWCYRRCSDLAGDQIKQIIPFLHGINSVLNLQEQSNNVSTDSDSQTTEPFVEFFKTQRQNNRRLVETVIDLCRKDFKTARPDVGPCEINFMEKCCELCWYMLISDPPMVIEYEHLEKKPIDVNKFNKYDKSFTTVEYVVWPALLLHKDGPVLAKGTVQTFDHKENAKTNIQ